MYSCIVAYHNAIIMFLFSLIFAIEIDKIDEIHEVITFKRLFRDSEDHKFIGTNTCAYIKAIYLV